MNFKVHSFSNAKTTSWPGGTTTELLISPTDAKFAERDFDFRISSATIETDESTFTSLPDYNRLLAVLEGEIEIIHEGKYAKHLSKFECDSFHGSWKTTSKGKVRDFNVIYSDRYALDFNLASMEETEIISKTSDFLFLFLLEEVYFDGIQLKKYDLLEIGETVETVQINVNHPITHDLNRGLSDAGEITFEKGFLCFEIRLKKVS